MDEVSHAGPVARVIVAPEHFEVGALTQSNFDGDRYGVSFRGMPFPNSSLEVCAGSIELTQDTRAVPDTLFLVEGSRIANGFTYLNRCSEMHDGNRFVFPQNLFQPFAISDIAYFKRAPLY